MCTQPITINNPSVYHNRFFSAEKLQVPCGHCDECNLSQQGDWRTRLNFEVENLYSRGGIGVFLTFTYDEKNLPHFSYPPIPERMPKDLVYYLLNDRPQTYKDSFFDDSNPTFNLSKSLYYNTLWLDDVVEFNQTDIPCFDKEHVQKFLNNLKVRANSLYGAGSYKYFWVCEYGGKTCRPHYHCLFMLEPVVNWHEFTELCRSLWSYGFMFPYYDEDLKIYRNDKFEEVPPTLRSHKNASAYVTKYLLKDFNFFSNCTLSFVTSFMSYWRFLSQNLDLKYHPIHNFYKSVRNQMPFHLQSNGIGACILDYLDKDNLSSALTDGIFLPHFQEDIKPFKVPLPQYICQKLIYKSVPSERSSRLSGKMLYDKVLTPFGEEYLYSCLKGRIARYKSKVFKFVMSDSFFVSLAEKFALSCPVPVSPLSTKPFNQNKFVNDFVRYCREKLHAFRSLGNDRFDLLAKYHFCVSKYPDSLLLHCFETAVSPYDDKICRLFTVRSHDVRYKKRFQTKHASFPQVHFVVVHKAVVEFHDVLCQLQRFYRKQMNSDRIELDRKNSVIRREVIAKYDKSLC